MPRRRGTKGWALGGYRSVATCATGELVVDALLLRDRRRRHVGRARPASRRRTREGPPQWPRDPSWPSPSGRRPCSCVAATDASLARSGGAPHERGVRRLTNTGLPGTGRLGASWGVVSGNVRGEGEILAVAETLAPGRVGGAGAEFRLSCVFFVAAVGEKPSDVCGLSGVTSGLVAPHVVVKKECRKSGLRMGVTGEGALPLAPGPPPAPAPACPARVLRGTGTNRGGGGLSTSSPCQELPTPT